MEKSLFSAAEPGTGSRTRPLAGLRLSACGGAFTLLGALLGCSGSPSPASSPVAPSTPTLSEPVGGAENDITKADLFDAPTNPWRDPPKLQPDQNGVFRLDVQMARNTISMAGEDYPVNLRSYNGGLVGGTIEIEGTGVPKVRLTNRLPRETGDCRHSNTPKCFNLTNIHTHGLHVSPSDPADNVFLSINGGDPPRLYEYDIKNHYPGTFWYHAHRHGTTALQLGSGMSGALIVRGDIDRYPGVRGTVERIFILQQLAFDGDGELKEFNHLRQNWEGGMWRRGCSSTNPRCHCQGGTDCRNAGPSKRTTINGVVKPLLEMRSGEVQRWRFVDSGIFEMLDLVLVNAAPFHQIAIDGITLKNVVRRPVVQLGPGYRTDVLVQAPVVREGETRTLYLYKRKAAFALSATEPSVDTVDDAQILAEIKVSGQCGTGCVSTLLPAGTPLPHPMKDIATPDLPRRNIVFNQDLQNHPAFNINGKRHNHHRMDHQLKLNDAEEWSLRSELGFHPFHIHVNAFQMLDDQGNPAEWRDTIIVPPNKTLRMRTRYENFTGAFVLHCHILDHEDVGMMQNVCISESGRCSMPQMDGM